MKERTLEEVKAAVQQAHEKGIYAQDFTNSTNLAARLAIEYNVPQDIAAAADMFSRVGMSRAINKTPTVHSVVMENVLEVLASLLCKAHNVTAEQFGRVTDAAAEANLQSALIYAKRMKEAGL